MEKKRYSHHRTPSGRKSEDKETCEAYHCRRRALGILGIVAVECEVADRGENQEANEHPARSSDERLAAAVVFDDIQAIEGDAEVNAVLRVVSSSTKRECRARDVPRSSALQTSS